MILRCHLLIAPESVGYRVSRTRLINLPHFFWTLNGASNKQMHPAEPKRRPSGCRYYGTLDALRFGTDSRNQETKTKQNTSPKAGRRTVPQGDGIGTMTRSSVDLSRHKIQSDFGGALSAMTLVCYGATRNTEQEYGYLEKQTRQECG